MIIVQFLLEFNRGIGTSFCFSSLAYLWHSAWIKRCRHIKHLYKQTDALSNQGQVNLKSYISNFCPSMLSLKYFLYNFVLPWKGQSCVISLINKTKYAWICCCTTVTFRNHHLQLSLCQLKITFTTVNFKHAITSGNFIIMWLLCDFFLCTADGICNLEINPYFITASIKTMETEKCQLYSI